MFAFLSRNILITFIQKVARKSSFVNTVTKVTFLNQPYTIINGVDIIVIKNICVIFVEKSTIIRLR